MNRRAAIRVVMTAGEHGSSRQWIFVPEREYISFLMTIGTYIATGAAAFLLGSFPTAYLVIRRRSGKDIRREGSGNVGTLNALEVSGSRSVGIVVLVTDLAKGAIPLAALHLLGMRDFYLGLTALLSVVAGHNYSPWLGFRGGRGLASAAGASLLFNPLFIAYWGALWLAGYLKSRNVHFGNLAATILAPFLLAVAPGLACRASLFPCTEGEVVLAGFLLCGLIFLRHIEPLKQLISKQPTITQ